LFDRDYLPQLSTLGEKTRPSKVWDAIIGQRYSEGEDMGRQMRAIAICLSFLMLGPFSTDTFAKGPKNPHGRGPKNAHARKAKNFHAGAVYVLTNQTNHSE